MTFIITTSKMTNQYKLMIYFAHSTLVMYSGSIYSRKKMNVSEFRKWNKEVIKTVFDEGLSIMNYELSYEQVSRACLVFLQTKYFPQTIKETKRMNVLLGFLKRIYVWIVSILK